MRQHCVLSRTPTGSLACADCSRLRAHHLVDVETGMYLPEPFDLPLLIEIHIPPLLACFCDFPIIIAVMADEFGELFVV